MDTDLSSPIGLIAGSGALPIEFCNSAKEKGLELFVVCHKGETDPEIEGVADQTLWINVGQLGKALKGLKKAGVGQVAFAGGIRKVGVFKGFRPDLRAIKVITKVGSIEDDKILRGVASEIESEGISVISASVLLERLVTREGLLTKGELTSQEKEDLELGWKTAKQIGELEIGQGVVCFGGIIVAVEAVEGTDQMLERAGQLIGNSSGKMVQDGAPVLVKVSKPQQDLRLDLPTIGVDTITRANEAGIGVIVLEAEKSIILDPVQVIEEANKVGIKLIGRSRASLKSNATK